MNINRTHFTKHWDFILLDVLILQLSLVLAHLIVRGMEQSYINSLNLFMASLMFICQILAIAFTDNYSGILRRGPLDEAYRVIKGIIETGVTVTVAIFVTRMYLYVSRLETGMAFILFAVLSYLVRQLVKSALRRSVQKSHKLKSLILITDRANVDSAVNSLITENIYRDFKISKILLLDGATGEEKSDIPMVTANNEALRDICHEWVDEAFILQPENGSYPKHIVDSLMQMGITVNYMITSFTDTTLPYTTVTQLGSYNVLSFSRRQVSTGELIVKRIMDIVGGLIGCILTILISVFIAPAIIAEDGAPVIFTQKRVGRNGKIFKMHKFRSMYKDAEERKKDLEKQNKIDSGLMFKMDNDPRILGSHKKDKNGRPKGIGNFIRKTSIDEFPQFFDVLIGNMSLVGTRPPTVDEYNRYELQHRIRMSAKPGITGMWQVSGRSDITDFDEVVRLDTEYIDNWSLYLDIKIILKTIGVVIKGKGAS